MTETHQIIETMNRMNKTLRVLAIALLAVAVMPGCDNNKPSNPSDNMKSPLETIMTRTSIRSYTDRAVAADTIELLLRAGMAAPTAVNAQPWHFVVVNDRAKLDEFAGPSRLGDM